MSNPLDALNQARRAVRPPIDLDAVRNPKPEYPDPTQNLPEQPDLETAIKEDFKAVKRAFQEQDESQKNQFKNLYNSHWYYTDVYPTFEHCEYSMAIQNRLLAVNEKQMGQGYYRNGLYLIKAFQALAKELGIDISDIPKPTD
ncbi:hypothetical protein QP400_00370 [Winkia sp. UMB3158]|uniref:Uncharacterized protein n=7 Tax=Bacillati TaxID=1783272 RepID=A0AB38XR61_9ACTO|nr:MULTISPECIES: hypothetical protein [Terrabacteria group]MDK8341224.1 hypothetical protein [Winkia sp. UMB3164B]OFT55548.1 hypothetical protein HMPREF3152_04590 [Actinomyces sp. HMSC06A08]MDK6240178.1 hypothetical protein [Winkia sp. UMB10116]MDK6266713.1 hypothetical protein [Streptococcus agalactiae]MDK6471407.1 hypothetical protein [Streptococcus agalactiae]